MLAAPSPLARDSPPPKPVTRHLDAVHLSELPYVTKMITCGPVSHAVLLYLNKKTFVGKEGQTLANEVRQLRAHGIDIILVHENDRARDGCEFHKCVARPWPTLPQLASACCLE